MDVALGEFDDKPCGKERYQRSLLFSGGSLSTGKRTASTCAHARGRALRTFWKGSSTFYVGKEAFKVEAGECVFLPRFKPHAFVIRSPWLRVLALFSPAGLEEAFRSIDSPAQSLELPTAPLTNWADAGKAWHGIKQLKAEDLKQTVQLLAEYGAHFLPPDEVADQLPLYPKPLPPNPGK